MLTETGKQMPHIIRLKLKWLIFAKTFNVKKRLAYNAQHSNLCLIKGLEFLKLVTCNPKSTLMTLEVYMIANCLYNEFVIHIKELQQAYSANIGYLLIEIREIVKTLAVQLEGE